MDHLAAQHQELEQGRWEQMPFPLQMANIGSEVSRAIRWADKGKQDRAKRAAYRALELMDFTIAAAQRLDGSRKRSRLRELCRCREELCDCLLGTNEFKTDANVLQKYYDQFASLSLKHAQEG